MGFRFHARQQARALGLSGWVRNANDGTVEAVVAGEQDLVDRFVDWVKSEHSPGYVERVVNSPCAIEPPETSFQIRS